MNQFIEPQSALRPFWKFAYTAGEVAQGAATQRDFRKSRMEWWQAKKQETMDAIRKEGIEITESVADQLVAQTMSTYGGTRAVGPQVSIRQDLVRQLSECQQKIDHHRRKVDEYNAWVAFLGRDAIRGFGLELTHEDWQFFFGKTE